MERYRVLYDIKSLETLLVRTFVNDKISLCENIKNFPTPTQMQIIEYIVDAKTDVYQRDLESILHLRRATVSGVLQTMEKNHVIERVSSENDGRVKKIILNARAKTLFSEHKKRLEQIEKLITEDITEYDLQIFSGVLDTMRKNIYKYSSDQDIVSDLRKGDR